MQHKCTFGASLLGKCLKHLFQSTRLHARHELPCKAPLSALPVFPLRISSRVFTIHLPIYTLIDEQLASRPPGMPYNLCLYDIIPHHDHAWARALPRSAVVPASQARCLFGFVAPRAAPVHSVKLQIV